MLVMGVPVGYSSANTMTDLSTAIKRGDKGDGAYENTKGDHRRNSGSGNF